MHLEGQRVGRYQLVRLLGHGGMGEVYLAEDSRIEQQVAIKVIRTDATPYPGKESSLEATSLFLREVKAIARLDHPNILPLYDYGEERVEGMDLTYLVMPYRKEGSFAHWLRQRDQGKWPTLEDTAFFLMQAAEALQHAHDHHIIHQDVKPSNFLLRGRQDRPNRPDLLLADFGIAKFTGATAGVSSTIRGTPTHMAPEQWQARPVFATDQYALAVMAYQLVTGRVPFQGGMEQMMYLHLHAQPPVPSSLVPQLPGSLDAVLLRGLAKRPEERFPSVTAFAQAFEQAIIKRGVRPANLLEIARGPELQATLAISELEARMGTMRTLTLPGGRRVNVVVPPGAFNGQTLRLNGLGEAAIAGMPPGDLLITLTIIPIESGPAIQLSPSSEEHTIISASSRFQPLPPGPTVQKMELHTPDPTTPWVEPPPPAPPTTPGMEPAFSGPITPTIDLFPSGPDLIRPGASGLPPTIVDTGVIRKKQTFPWIKAALLIALVLLIIAGSAGFFLFERNQQISTAHSQATATANAALTATAIAIDSQIPYPPYKGKLVLNDPLTYNNNAYGWTRGYLPGDVSTTCIFTGGAYHIIEANHGRFYYCVAQKTSFHNFVFQIQMTFIQGSSGDYGGILIRSEGFRHYFFRIGRDGTYLFRVYTNDSTGAGSVLTQGSSPAIHTGLNQPNILAIAARGGTFALYVNHQLVDSVNDTTYKQGQIGLVAGDEVTLTEVAFNNAKVWAL